MKVALWYPVNFDCHIISLWLDWSFLDHAGIRDLLTFWTLSYSLLVRGNGIYTGQNEIAKQKRQQKAVLCLFGFVLIDAALAGLDLTGQNRLDWN